MIEVQSYTSHHGRRSFSAAHRELYNILISAVGPRPIAWVSTVSVRTTNLPPFRFFNAVCAKPPLLALRRRCERRKKSDGTAKSAGTPKTRADIRETKEFVINVVTSELAEAMT